MILVSARDALSTAAPALTVGEERFCREYLKDGSHWAAAVRAGYTARPGHVDYNYGLIFLAKPEVQAYLEVLRREHVRQAVIEPAAILREYWEIATADPAELTLASRRACRHCYGTDFAYQWKGDWEFAKAFEEASAELERWQAMPATVRGRQPKLPAYPADGRWFDWQADPNPDCPHCEGQGLLSIDIADIRRLSPKARRLFAGVKPTRDGWEVKMRDQDGALKAVAAAIGMITEGHGSTLPGATATFTRDQLARLAPEDLDKMIEISSKLLLGGGDDGTVAREGQRENGSADTARSGSAGAADVAK